MFTNLHDMLNAQYGQGTYLTNGALDYSQTVRFEPRLCGKFGGLARIPDRFMFETDVPYGDGAVSMGQWDGQFSNPLGYDGVFLFAVTIKKPGTDEHILPRQLAHMAPIIQEIASMEYALNGNTRDKYCGIMMRTLPLTSGVKQVSENDWHAHHVLTADYLRAKNRDRFLEIPEDTLEQLPLLSTRVAQTEYLYSNICGSLVQTRPAAQPMEYVEGDGVYMLKRPPLNFRQTADGEIVRSNSLVFHCAATPDAKDYGRLRTLLFVGYTATKAMETRLKL
ncbi:MAG: hypothetical protein EBQ96_01545 [Proteobacteria bacterium]|nr:hypothetical protein [Pseudomonadota bacterium]